MNQKFMRYFIIFLLVIHMMYIFFNFEKWQLFPFYVFWLLFFLVIVSNVSKRLHQKIFTWIGTLSLLLSLGLFYAFPKMNIPDPSGQYKIGTLTFVIQDEERLEWYTDDPEDKRRFAFTMWYPADEVDHKDVAKWIGHSEISKELAKGIGLPSFVLNQTSEILSNSYTFASFSNDQDTYPVVIISHGWGGFMSLHTDLAEELASRGYVVISIDHTYGSVATAFDDDIVYQNKNALPNRSEDTFLDAANQLVYTYAGDILKTLDYLEEENALNASSSFKGRLDLDHIGLMGHSTGGGADVAVALSDDRIKALIGLDAWVEPIDEEEIRNGLNIPAIFLRSATWEEGLNNANLYELILKSDQARLYQIDGTTHSDFSMAYMFSPLTGTIGYTGSLDKLYLVQMQKDIMNQFFDEHLKGMTNQDIDLSIYEELKMIEVT